MGPDTLLDHFTGSITFYSHNNSLKMELLLPQFSKEKKLKQRSQVTSSHSQEAMKPRFKHKPCHSEPRLLISYLLIKTHNQISVIRSHKHSKAAWPHPAMTPASTLSFLSSVWKNDHRSSNLVFKKTSTYYFPFLPLKDIIWPLLKAQPWACFSFSVRRKFIQFIFLKC